MQLKQLKLHIAEMEHKVPMLTFQASDEMSQIKRFILRYYEPLLSQLEKEQLEDL